jgi:hypothetical protein
MNWAGHVVHIREKRNTYEVLIRKSGRIDTRKAKGVDGRLILKLILIG